MRSRFFYGNVLMLFSSQLKHINSLMFFWSKNKTYKKSPTLLEQCRGKKCGVYCYTPEHLQYSIHASQSTERGDHDDKKRHQSSQRHGKHHLYPPWRQKILDGTCDSGI